MRAILQRVSEASVVVDGAEVSRIGRGLLVLLGVCSGDDASDVQYIAGRLLSARLWPGGDGRAWTASAASERLPILVVSQFTLYAKTRKPRPDFARAAPAQVARSLYQDTLAALAAGHPLGAAGVQSGVFQAMMSVSLVNDGPVTVIIDSKNKDDELPGQQGGAGGAPQAGEGEDGTQ